MKNETKIVRLLYENRVWVVFTIIAIAIIGICFFRGPIVRFWYESTVDQKCVEEMEKINGNNFHGGILSISFYPNVSEQDALQMLNFHGLYMDNFGTEYKTTNVYVPDGKEIIWLCTLRESHLVEYTQLNYIVHASSGAENV